MGYYAKRFFGKAKGEPRDPDLVMTVDTSITASSTVARRYEFVLKAGDKDVTIDWGDGTINNYTATDATTVGRTYATAGIYQIRIAGSYPGFHNSGNYYNSRIVSLDNWGTNEFTSMYLMFHQAKNMIANYTDKPNTSKVTTFRSCFFNAEKFNGIVNFDTSNAVSLRGMFYNSSALLPQSFAHFNIEKLEPGTNTGLDLFMGKHLYPPLDMNESGIADNYDDTLISFASQNAPNGIVAHFGNSMYSVRGKAAREALVAKGWTITDAGYEWATDADFEKATYGRFSYIGTKQYVVIPHTIKGINVTNYSGMFNGKSIKGVYSDNFNVTSMSSMFSNSRETSLDLTYLNTSKVTNMGGMFSYSVATKINGLQNFNTSNVTSMSTMFSGSYATSLDLSSFDTSRVTNMASMFNSSQATSLDLSSFDTSNVTNMSYMFWNSEATTGYARTQADADRFNASSGKPYSLKFIVKPQ